MQSINCYILELSQCIKACIIYKLLLLYYYTSFPPSLSYHSLPIFDHSFQQAPGIDNIYHPLTAIITTNLLCHSLPSIPFSQRRPPSGSTLSFISSPNSIPRWEVYQTSYARCQFFMIECLKYILHGLGKSFLVLCKCQEICGISGVTASVMLLTYEVYACIIHRLG